MNKKSFTILEILVSLMIIGIIAGFGYNQYTRAMLKTNSTALINQFKNLEASMAKYYSDTGTMPTDLAFLFASPFVDNVADLNYTASDTGNADRLDLFGFVDGDASEEIKDYWGGPYIEKIDTTGLNPGSGAVEQLKMDDLTCSTGVIKKPSNPASNVVCLKAKLGGKICVGTATDGVDGDNYNVFIVDGINFDMAKELYAAANSKAIGSTQNLNGGGNADGNASEVVLGNISDKLGVGNPSDYQNEKGCVVWRYYDSTLRKE